MRWDLIGSSLGDSSKESGSLLGTRREIARKKTGGLTARLPEVAGVCGTNLLANSGEIPLHHPNLGSILKLDPGPSSSCNFIALVIVRPA
ncbi:hypothetical protein B296_00010238 [Ensete ventricosum]|uniref:Uncharacterized protein n=1 Tax=Ensete ventricosum TaxID=4639 RepID=A0A426ZU28_ENSVE|nr:hypothetical protein B296_00010238 [Ensete ventricosum]